MAERGDIRFDPPRRREPAPFEPPPWEKDAFERLERERAERGSREAALGGAAQDTTEAAEMASQAVSVPGGEAPGEPAVAEMLLRLKEEEPRAAAGVWKVGVVAGLFIGVVGLALIVWASVALAATLRAGPVGWFGSGVMSLMGFGLVGLGVWLGSRSLRNRGVL